jgi:hypothetical protein
MKIGGYVMLSISVLSASESIHRKTRIAGDTITNPDSQKPILRSQRFSGTRARGVARVGAATLAKSIWSSRGRAASTSASASTITEEHDDDRRGRADVVERERLQIKIEVDRFRRGARARRR